MKQDPIKIFINIYLGIFAILTVTMMMLVMAQVVGRYFMGKSPLWIEEIVGYILVFVGLMGSSYTFYEKRHIALTVLESNLKKASHRRYLSIFIDLMIIIFAISIQIVGGILFYNQTKHLISPGGTFSLGMLHILLPISGVILVVLLITSIYRTLTDKTGEEDLVK